MKYRYEVLICGTGIGAWCENRHGTPILQVAHNALNCSELLCAPFRHGGARRSGEGAGYQSGAGHRDVARDSIMR